jgi:hypothetical protein
VVMKALSRDPGQRFESAAAFRKAILAANSGPVNSTVSQETVLIAPAGPQRGRSGDSGAASAPSRPGSGSGGRTPWPPGWDPMTLGSVQTQLATVVGPMARVLVQRAAQRCGDVDTLVNLIAEELQSVDERTAFLSSLSTGPFTPVHGRKPAPAPRPAGFANSAFGDGLARLGPQEIERATAALAKRIGPLARLMVRRAHDRTDDPEQFLLLLLEGIGSQADREAFLRDIRPPH